MIYRKANLVSTFLMLEDTWIIMGYMFTDVGALTDVGEYMGPDDTSDRYSHISQTARQRALI